MRTHSHKPIKILQILSREKIKKMFNITPKYFRIFNNNLPASWVKHTCYSAGSSIHVIPVRIIVLWLMILTSKAVLLNLVQGFIETEV